MPFDPPSAVLSTAGAGGWTLVEPLSYVGRSDRFVVPSGFRTDLASVPRPVLWLVPESGRYTLAAVLHDWLCTVGIATGVVTSRQADGVFRRVMREGGVPVLLRWLMWAGVRWGALTDPERRPGWWASAPGVLAISVLAAPLVLPSVLLLPGLLLYAVAERLVSGEGVRPWDRAARDGRADEAAGHE
ncbi:Protein of unknown function [Geodermatophilus telluris]|uniref:DUF1353 domain-containing protein n=1 Tax=Geodermatophilus telluris TaxID=1190417 RepID=A0A1G6SEC3_9ACTN|nr:DUF1353 domain-containing protein [Geodermatophilus telluris]SDD15280.1 Protein of unknown function [Geodermatophilus telluris]